MSWVKYRLKDIDEHYIHYWEYPLSMIYHDFHRFRVFYENLLVSDKEPDNNNNMTLLAGCNLTGRR